MPWFRLNRTSQNLTLQSVEELGYQIQIDSLDLLTPYDPGRPPRMVRGQASRAALAAVGWNPPRQAESYRGHRGHVEHRHDERERTPAAEQAQMIAARSTKAERDMDKPPAKGERTSERMEYLAARPILSMAEAGELVGISRSTLLRARRSGVLPARKLGEAGTAGRVVILRCRV